MKIKDIAGIFRKPPDALIVVDIGADLKLLDITLKPEPKLKAIKIFYLPSEKTNEAILNSLRSFIQENNITHNNVILKPVINTLFVKRIEMPFIPQDELREAIKLKLKPDAPFDLTGAAFDFSIVGEISKGDGSKILDILCVAIPQQEIREQVLLLKQLGLVCVAVNFLPWGYTSLINKYMKQQDDQPLGVLEMQADRCYICVYRNNRFVFYRELPVTINKLREALSDTVVTDQGKIQLSPQEIDKTLFEQGLPAQANQTLAMLRPELERLAQEIKRSIVYYDAQFHGGAVNRVLLGGLASAIPNLDTFLSAETSLNCQRISLLGLDKDIAAKNVDLEALSQSYASFGLAVGYENNVNLLPYEFRTEKIEKFQMASLRWVVFIASLLLLVSYIFARASISAYQKHLDNARLQLNVLSEIRDIKTRADELGLFIQNVKDSQAPVDKILSDLSTIIGKGLFFESCSVDVAAKRINIDGFVRSEGNKDNDVVLTQFASNMEKLASFEEATISSVEKSGSGETAVTRFHLTAKLQ